MASAGSSTFSSTLRNTPGDSWAATASHSTVAIDCLDAHLNLIKAIQWVLGKFAEIHS